MIRNFTSFCGVLLLAIGFAAAQGTICQNADPFCTGSTATFPAGVNAGYAQAGANYGCLYTQPNPAWYYMQVDTSGTIDIEMHSTPAHDIDFACWGPFTSPTTPCVAQLTAGPNTPTHAVPGPSTYYPTLNMIDCSYSIYSTEYCYIPNGQTGQFYLLLITNYSNQQCDISFSQTGGTGTTSCSILPYISGDSVCVGQTIHLTVLIPTPGATYVWTGPNLFYSTLQNPTIPNATPADAGTYTMTMTVNGVPSPPITCQVLVGQYPTITITPANPQPCAGQPFVYTGHSTDPNTTYHWSTGQTTNPASIAVPGPTTIYVTGTTLSGCPGVDSIHVTPFPAPTVTVAGNFPTPPGGPYLCGGQSILLNASGASTYSWDHGLGAGNPKTVTPVGNSTYTVTGTDANGCTASSSIFIQPVGPSISIAPPNPTICEGASVKLTASSATTYHWSHGLDPFDTVYMSLGWKCKVWVHPTVTTTYTVTGTDAGGCTASQIKTVNVTPGNPVSATITAVPSGNICPGTSVTFTVTPTNGGANPAYQWRKNGTNIPGATGTTYTSAALADNDVITCVLTSNVTCPLGNPATSNSITIHVFANLVTGVSITALPPGPICTGTNVVFTATPSNGGVPTYVWKKNGSPVGSNSPTWSSNTLNNNDVITCTMTTSLSCSAPPTVTSSSITMTVSPPPNVNITSAGPFCMSNAAVTLHAADTGGIWAGPGITNPLTGTFNPDSAGPGTHIISYRINNTPCPDTGFITIDVSALVNATIQPEGPFCISDPIFTLVSVSGGGVWTGQGIIDNNAGIFDPLTAGAGSHVITYTISGACSDVGTTTIVVNSVANATINPPGTLCTAQPPVTLTAGTGGGVWSGTGIINDSLGIFSPAVAGVGVHPITYMISGGACADTGYINITVVASPNATITHAGPYCTADAPVNLTAATSGGTWSGTGITIPGAGTFSPAVATAGTHIITYVVSVGGCSSTDTASIVVHSSPDATINPAGPFCSNQSPVTLTALTPGGTWSGAGITSPTLGTFSPVTAGAGIHPITYTLNTGFCTDTKQINITVNYIAAATINPAGPYCLSDPAATLTGVNPGGMWYGTGITNNAFGTFTPGNAGNGVHTIMHIITSGSCADTAYINISVSNSFNATINNPGTICSDQGPLTLTAADPGGVWSGTGITSTSLGTFSPAVAGPGPHTISYSVGSGACAANSQIILNVNNAPNAHINNPGTYCSGSAIDTLTAVSPGGIWSGTGIVNNSLGTFNPATAGTYLITYLIGGVCPDTGTITLTVTNQANATIDAAGPYCQNDPADTLTAHDPGGVWAGTGITNGTVGIFDPAVAGPGTWVITYSINIGLCSDVKQTTIIVNNAVNANITPAGPYCINSGVHTMSAVSSGGSWSGAGITSSSLGTFDPAIAGPGTHLIMYSITGTCAATGYANIVVDSIPYATIDSSGPYCITGAPVNLTAVTPGGVWSGTGITNTALGTFNPATAGMGTHTITYHVINGMCSATGQFDIEVDSLMNANINPAGPFCITAASVNLTAATPGGVWSGPGITDSVLGTFNPDSAGAGSHIISYMISGLCPNTGHYTINVITSVDATIDSAGPYCTDHAAVTLTAVDPGGVWSGTGITDSTLGTFNPNTAGPGTHVITYMINSGQCSDTGTISIIVNHKANATITAAGPFCLVDTTVTLTAIDPGGIWSGTGITNSTLGTFNPDSAGAGAHTITYSIAGPCPDTKTVSITVNNQADASITPSGPYCAYDTVRTLTAADPGGTWSGMSFIDPSAGTFNPSLVTAGVYTVTYSIPGACGATGTKDITINAVAALSGIATDESCKDKGDGSIDLTIEGGTPPYAISWSNGSTTEDLTNLVPGHYVVIVSDTKSCDNTKGFDVLASETSCESPALYIPNIFTPNGDGKNDILFVRGAAFKELSFSIYDRWGELVFFTDTKDKGWDGTLKGKPMDNAVYVYYVNVTFTTGDVVSKHGNITLTR